jgi:predicted DNA-binding protein (MmcQ/YjbR family)
MNIQDIFDYCLSKPCAYIDYPFGPIPVCLKVKDRLFAQVYPDPEDLKITLNCDLMTGESYRALFPGTVVRGYHCPPVQQPYFNTIFLNGTVPDPVLLDMIDHSYSVVTGKLPQYIRKTFL